MAPQPQTSGWLVEHGPDQLEMLLRAIVFNPSASILLTDDDRRYRDANFGASRLLGLPRDKIIGRRLEDFAEPGLQATIAARWQDFLHDGEQEGTLKLVGPDGAPKTVGYLAKGHILPVRHILLLQEATAPGGAAADPGSEPSSLPSWAQDYALFLLDSIGKIHDWYAGAGRIYGYSRDAVVGQHVSCLSPDLEAPRELERELERAARDGHFGAENWHQKEDGSRFWANVITMALRDDRSELQGFAVVVRDFSDRHERDEKLRRDRARMRPIPMHPTVAGVVSGGFDRIPDANDAFLELVGYSREDVQEGRMYWPGLTPAEYVPLDELAHEECLRFGACTPFEKQLERRDGSRVPVMVATAVLKLAPFQWITFVQDLRERDRIERVDEQEGDVSDEFLEIVGTSAALRRVQRQVELVAPTDANVLILGETGTGKELVARAIHRLSPRKDLPFVTLNCAAIPTGLLESELFGYERGAFTGALAQKIGRFEMANRGTLFLDEVGDIPLELQPKLLRALQEKCFERLGGTRTIPIDVRLVAATNRNLAQMMGDKLFRSDLYYRLKVFPITTPPLRDRPEDIPVLARHFTKKYAQKMARQIDKIPADTMQALLHWQWPGNVRELENFIERSVILSSGSSLRAPLAEIKPNAASRGSSLDNLEQVERDHILRVLRDSGGVVTAAATRLGLHRTTLNAMMKKLGISRKEFSGPA